MFKMKSYPTAFQLSVLAQEEFGKILIIEDVVWNRRFNKMSDKWTQRWFGLTVNHKIKQVKMLRDSKFLESRAMKLMDNIMKGGLEKEKQAATYAGLKDNKIGGRLINPFKISRTKAFTQINKLNQDALSIAEKIKSGVWELDSELVQKYFKRVILPKLARRKHKLEKLVFTKK
jgi:AbiV family abortive infection protein